MSDDLNDWGFLQGGGKALPGGLDAVLEQLASRRQGTDLATPLVQIDTDIVHGWPSSVAALTAFTADVGRL